MVLSCQPKLLNHLSSKTIFLTLQVKCVRKGEICVWFAQVMIRLLAMIYRSHSFIAFHGSLVQCLLSDVLLLKTSHSLTSAAAQTVIPQGFFCAGHIRRTVNSRAAPTLYLAATGFWLNKRMFWYLAHRPYRPRCPQPNISLRLIHVQAEVSYCYSREELLQCCSVLYSEVWSDCYRKQALPILTLTC